MAALSVVEGLSTLATGPVTQPLQGFERSGGACQGPENPVELPNKAHRKLAKWMQHCIWRIVQTLKFSERAWRESFITAFNRGALQVLKLDSFHRSFRHGPSWISIITRQLRSRERVHVSSSVTMSRSRSGSENLEIFPY